MATLQNVRTNLTSIETAERALKDALDQLADLRRRARHDTSLNNPHLGTLFPNDNADAYLAIQNPIYAARKAALVSAFSLLP